MADASEYISFSAGGYTVSGVVTAADWAQIQSGAECWISVIEAQSRDEDGRVLDFGEITVLFRDGTVAERREGTPERP